MKTRLFTRKRALISSVAMLLVAMIALGTATFAWFVADPTAKAEGLQMKTTTSTGLVIDTQFDGNTTFTHDEDFNVQSTNGGSSTYAANVQLSPTSMTSTGAMKTVEAAASTSYKGKVGAAVTAPDASAKTYYSETIDAKTTDGQASTITKATVTLTEAANAPAIKQAFKVALLSGTTVLATWAASADNAARYLDNDVSTYPETVTTTREVVATGTQKTISVAIPENSTTTLTLVAYLDGEQDECYSDQASLADCFSNVKLDLSL